MICSGFCSSISGKVDYGSGISVSEDSCSKISVSGVDSAHVFLEDSRVSGCCDTEMESWTWTRGDSWTRT